MSAYNRLRADFDPAGPLDVIVTVVDRNGEVATTRFRRASAALEVATSVAGQAPITQMRITTIQPIELEQPFEIEQPTGKRSHEQHR